MTRQFVGNEPEGEVNIEITMDMKDGTHLKHIIRGYELLGIQKDPETGNIAFITQKPTYKASAWTIARMESFDLDKVEAQRNTDKDVFLNVEKETVNVPRSTAG